MYSIGCVAINTAVAENYIFFLIYPVILLRWAHE